MKPMTKLLASIASSSILLATMPAYSINLPFQPTDFSGGATNFGIVDPTPSNVSGTGNFLANPINTGDFGTRTGFGTGGVTPFFTSNFLLLGASGGTGQRAFPPLPPVVDTNITTDSNRSQNNVALSIPFAITAADISTGGLRLEFNWAFNGNSQGIPNFDFDNFNIILVNTAGSAFGSGFFFARDTTGYGRNNGEVALLTVANALLPGNYNIILTLNENTDGSLNSSAAGFNNIVLVPFEFTPLTGLFGLGAIFGASNLYKRRKKLLSHFSAKTEPED